MERDLLLCNPACLDAVGQCWVYDPGMNCESTARIWSVQHPVSLQGQVRTAGSKSVAQRVIFLALLAHGESQVIGAPKNDDLEIFVAALIDLGFEISGTVTGATEDRRLCRSIPCRCRSHRCWRQRHRDAIPDGAAGVAWR